MVEVALKPYVLSSEEWKVYPCLLTMDRWTDRKIEIIKRGGRLSSQFILSVRLHLYILSREGVDFPVRLFLSVNLFICPSVHSFKRGGRLSCQIISICPSVHLSILSRKGVDFPVRFFLSVHSFKRGGRLSSQYISICPSVHLSILSREG